MNVRFCFCRINDGRKPMKPAELIKDGVSKVRTYWKNPPLGRYMTFKEIAAFPNDLSVSMGNVVYCFAFVDAFSIFKFLCFFFQSITLN